MLTPWAAQGAQRIPRVPKMHPKGPPEPPKRTPKYCQRLQNAPQTIPRVPKKAAKKPPEAPKCVLSVPQGPQKRAPTHQLENLLENVR